CHAGGRSRPPPRPRRFAYTTLFRSVHGAPALADDRRAYARAGGLDAREASGFLEDSLVEPALLLFGLVFRFRKINVEREHALGRSEEHTSELQSREKLVCRLLLVKKNLYGVVLIILITETSVFFGAVFVHAATYLHNVRFNQLLQLLLSALRNCVAFEALAALIE